MYKYVTVLICYKYQNLRSWPYMLPVDEKLKCSLVCFFFFNFMHIRVYFFFHLHVQCINLNLIDTCVFTVSRFMFYHG